MNFGLYLKRRVVIYLGITAKLMTGISPIEYGKF